MTTVNVGHQFAVVAIVQIEFGAIRYRVIHEDITGPLDCSLTSLAVYESLHC